MTAQIVTMPRMHFLSIYILFIATSVAAAEPYKNLSIGIEIALPNNAVVVATSDDPPSCMIQGSDAQESWHLKIDRIQDIQGKSAKELATLAYKSVLNTDQPTIIENKQMEIQGIEAWWLRASIPIDQGEDSTVCWLVVPVCGNQAVVASILTITKEWQRVGKTVLTALDSLSFLDPASILIDRMRGLDNATYLLSDLSVETLEPIIGINSWRQIQETKNGSIRPEDIGYAFISTRTGTIEALGTSKTSNGEIGLIVEVRSRILPDAQTGIITDTFGMYWMSFDGKEELWSSSTTRWKGKIKTVQKETGIRNRASLGDPKSSVLILRQDLTTNRQLNPIEITTDAFWLPKTLTWVIGPLLQSNTTASYAWHALNDYIDPPTQTMRSDTIEPTKTGFSVTTRLGDSDALVRTYYDNHGSFLRRSLNDGVHIYGTSEQALRAIWEPKGLW